MKKDKNIYIVIFSIFVALGLISFSIYSTKCLGEECNNIPEITEEEDLIFPKMIPEIISKQVENNEIFLLDVRDDSEWNIGHIAGAKHIALDNLNIKTIINVPKDVPVYVYCRSGGRANEATMKLRSLGFLNAENIGGIIYWQERGGLLTKL